MSKAMPWEDPYKKTYPDYNSHKEKNPIPVNPFTLLNPFINSWTIGFDRQFKLMEELRAASRPTYPPYNIKHMGNEKYMIELAVAGFNKSEITVEQTENTLRLSGSKDDHGSTYVYKGLAARDFEQTFVLSDYVVVKKVTLLDGLLTVYLERELPEEKKPKVIPISTK